MHLHHGPWACVTAFCLILFIIGCGGKEKQPCSTCLYDVNDD